MKKNRTSDYLDYDKIMETAHLLRKNPKTLLFGNYLIIAVNTGLRCSDVLQLTWDQLRLPKVEIEEKKTKKYKEFSVNDKIHKIIEPEYTGSPFITNKGSIICIQYLNRQLKKIFANEIKAGLRISSHTLRKSFGRRVYKNNNETEASLIFLSELLNHADLKTTKIYLGIRQEELDNIYMNL